MALSGALSLWGAGGAVNEGSQSSGLRSGFPPLGEYRRPQPLGWRLGLT